MGSLDKIAACLRRYLKRILYAALDNLQQSSWGPTDEAGIAVGNALAQLAKQLQRLALCVYDEVTRWA